MPSFYLFQTELTDLAISRVGDKLFCKFRRRKDYTFYYEDLETSERTMYSHKFTMDKKKHVLVATGPVYMSGNKEFFEIRFHLARQENLTN